MQRDESNPSALTRGSDHLDQPSQPNPTPQSPSQFFTNSTVSGPSQSLHTTPQGPQLPLTQTVSIPSHQTSDCEPFQIGIPIAPHDISHPHGNHHYAKGFEQMDSNSIPQNSKLQEVKNLSKVTRWIALINCVLILFYIASEMGYLVVLIVFPALGYAGARVYSANLCLWYMIFLVILMILDVVAMGMYPSSLVIVLSIFSILVDIFILRTFYKFYIIVRNLTYEEKAILLKVRYIQHGQYRVPAQNPRAVV